MMKSLFSGVSGLKNHTVRMDVIGNNIANVNTTGFKANTVTFRDVFYQTRSFASAGTNVSGGTNPRQVGYGLALGSIDKVMTQSGFTFSDKELDCAIVGEGFFQVMDPAGNIYYTRNGVFDIDNAGNLVDSNGYIVLGVSGDPTGMGPSTQRINLFVPDVMDQRASVVRPAPFNGEVYEVTFEASGYGPNGNISVNIQHSPVPFATMNGGTITVQLDLTQNFESPQAFEAAVNAAIAAGGVNPGDGVLPLSITFSGVPMEPNPDYIPQLDPNSPFFLTATTTPTRADWVAAQILAGRPAGFDTAYDIDTPRLIPNTMPIAARNTFTFVLPGQAVEGLTSSSRTVTTVPPTTTTVVTEIQTRIENPQIEFVARTPGSAANAFVVNLNYTDSLSATGVVARWSQSTLNITVPMGASVAEIQAAVDLAAGGRETHEFDITVTGDVSTRTRTIETIVSVPAAAGDGVNTTPWPDWSTITPAPVANNNALPWAELLANPRAIGLNGGQNNFYRSVMETIQRAQLRDGRYAGPQSTRDLELIFIDSGGIIYGEHAVHGRLLLGRIDLAIFQNANGLQQVGTSYFRESLSSGAAEVKIPESEGAGAVNSGALEMANVDLSQEFSDMIITQRGFQANSRIITVSDTMLEELINLKR